MFDHTLEAATAPKLLFAQPSTDTIPESTADDVPLASQKAALRSPGHTFNDAEAVEPTWKLLLTSPPPPSTPRRSPPHDSMNDSPSDQLLNCETPTWDCETPQAEAAFESVVSILRKAKEAEMAGTAVKVEAADAATSTAEVVLAAPVTLVNAPQSPPAALNPLHACETVAILPPIEATAAAAATPMSSQKGASPSDVAAMAKDAAGATPQATVRLLAPEPDALWQEAETPVQVPASAAAAAAVVEEAEHAADEAEEADNAEVSRASGSHSPAADMSPKCLVPSPIASTLTAAITFPSPISQPASLVPAAIDAAVKTHNTEQTSETSAKRNLDAVSDLLASSTTAPGAAAPVPARMTAAAAVVSPTAAAMRGPASATQTFALSPTYQAAAAATLAATAALQASARPTLAWDEPPRGGGRGCHKRRYSAVAVGSNSQRSRKRTTTDTARPASKMLVLPPPASPSPGTLLNRAALWSEVDNKRLASRPIAKYRPPVRTTGSGLGPGVLHPSGRLNSAQVFEEAKAYREIRFRRSPG